MNNAVLILPWYGRLPANFPYYLESISGKRFDVLWVSDADVPEHPDNFKLLRMSFDELKALIAKRLQTEVVINGGHRLCDFKPMYGHVFADYIGEYSYWGFGDCDLVYGEKMNEFIERTLDQGYDVVSMRRAYVSGATCFFRNEPKFVEMYRRAANWKEICAYEGTDIQLFDECGGRFHQQLRNGEMTMEDCSRIHDSFAAALFRAPGVRTYLGDDICESALARGEVVTMRNGRLFLDGDEIPVFHYILAKVPRWFRISAPRKSPVPCYRISATGLYAGELQWKMRFAIGPARRVQAIIESIGRHGIGHIWRRLVG